MSLRALVEADLAQTLENSSEWGQAVVLVGPTGLIQTQSANDATKLLTGRVEYNTIEQDPETGAQLIVPMSLVTLRQTSLDAVPLPSENWLVKIPVSPIAGAVTKDYVLSATRAPLDGKSIGFITLYLQDVEQS